ncbi:MAG: ABC transporter ATP-binding protein [Planctomycetaceae bacterium]|nr:ABC transporter ATP-binding protein [Planctomycetaceae bacterium]
MTSPMPLAIETRGLTKYYGETPVVHALDLRVPVGCVYGFLGRNGTGKSTTIKMLTGMVQPDAGEAFVLGEDVATMRPETRGRVAYVAEGHPLYRTMTIRQIEQFSKAFYPDWNGDLFDQILDHFELAPMQRIWWLSRGQRAQVALALAVAPDPELLILDDPTLGLDTVVRRDFLESMIQIIQRQGRTILFSSHVLGDVERVADRIGILIDGVLRVDCPTEHFKQAVRKLVLTFDGPPKPWPTTAGIVSDFVSGNRRELVIANYTDEHYETAQSLGASVVDVVELNLEDAFIEYTRGRKKSLPQFGTTDAPRKQVSPERIPS